MAIYDISVPISPRLTTWPGDPPVELVPWASLKNGDGYNLSALHFGTHTGTHVDAPLHFLQNGKAVDELVLELLVGPAWVADCRGVPEVTREALEAADIPADITRLLLLTDNASLWDDPSHPFRQRFVGVAESGAQWLLERGVRLVGVDYMSIDKADESAAHLLLLSNEAIVVENLDLRGIQPNHLYELICLPLRIAGGDGAPARALLRDLP